jgi:hypothetical protein
MSNEYPYLKKFILPTDIFDELKLRISQVDRTNKKLKWNMHLAGNIRDEYVLDADFPELYKFLDNFIFEKQNLRDYVLRQKIKAVQKEAPVSLYLANLWVNFMKKHEFNPVHKHFGVFSFVIFVKVPFVFKDQAEIGPGKESNSNSVGALDFIHIGLDNEIHSTTKLVDRTYEGTGYIFPANLCHTVYPYYEIDDERVTVSGNLFFVGKSPPMEDVQSANPDQPILTSTGEIIKND